jgi:tetratricopeptide (TPR) repeat protein
VLEEAFRRRPASVRIARALIDALQGLGAFDAAFQVARRLVAEGPEDPAAHALRAELAQARGAWSEALAAQRAILALARRRPGRVSPEARDQAQAAAEALVLLVGELDPVTAPRSCAPDAAPARRALAGRCEGNAARLR